MVLARRPARRAGTASAGPATLPTTRAPAVPDGVVVGRRQGQKAGGGASERRDASAQRDAADDRSARPTRSGVVPRRASRASARRARRRWLAALPCRRALARQAVPAAWRRHGLSAFGDLKYPADFKHFDYVNPTRRRAAPCRRRSPHRRQPGLRHLQHAQHLRAEGRRRGRAWSLTFDSLMARALDEPDALYGLVGAGGRGRRGRPHLSLPAAARGALPRRHAAHRAGRRLLAHDR